MTSSTLEKARAKGATLETINGWFNLLKDVLTKLNIIDKPHRIFNMDESGLLDDMGSRVAVVKRGTKYANQVQASSGKGCTTVLLTIGANSVAFPPYIIYKSTRLYQQWCPRNVIKGTVFNGTKSGWTDDQCFVDYLEKLFIPNTKNVEKPVLLIFDGHYSHLSIKSVQLAIQNNIHLSCLPSHCTHILQPLDIYTLRYVKQQWKQLLWERGKRNSATFEKKEFVHLFSKLYEYALIRAHCSTAFAKAGIHPFDPRAVKNDRIVKNILLQNELQSSHPQHLSQTLPSGSETLRNSNITEKNVGNKRVRSNSAPDFVSNSLPVSTNFHSLSGQIQRDIAAAPVATSRAPPATTPPAPPATTPPAPPATNTAAYKLLDNALNETRNFSLTTTTTTISPSASPPSSSSDKSLSAVEAIVSKYLSPKPTEYRKTKRVIKRQYGVSVTDLDVAAENAIAQQKKNAKVVKKRLPNNQNVETSKSKKSKPSLSQRLQQVLPLPLQLRPAFHQQIILQVILNH